MFVKHLQEYLDKFTDGTKGTAVSNAKIYMQVGNHLEEIGRIEVQEANLIGQDSIRVVLKPTREQLIVQHLGSGAVKLFRGSQILELEACGLELEACCLGLEACGLFFSELAA